MSTRRRILDASLELFAEKGFEATTVADVRERSGASTGSIYHHFTSREQLGLALYRDGLARYHAAILEVLESEPPAEAGVRALIGTHLRWATANQTLARFLLTTRRAEFMAEAADALRDDNRAFLRPLVGWCEAHIAGGALRRMPRDIYLAVLFGPAHEWLRHWLAAAARADSAGAALALGDAAWRALRPPTSQEQP